MKLAISNIAWETHNDPQVLGKLQAMNITGIEVAPTKVWPNWEGANRKNAEIYKQQLADQGFSIPAMQAILFGKPELQLFEQSNHHDFIAHMYRVAEIAAGLGARVLVLGAPKNRKRGQLPCDSAMERAAEFLRKIGEICHENQCCIGLEHNPVEYGCDFVTNVADARQLVDMIGHPGVQLHLDSAGIHMCGGDIENIILNAGEFAHYHISEPMLEPVVGGTVNHMAAAAALKKCGYDGWRSIEMKQPGQPHQVYDSITLAADCYFKP